MSLYFLPAFTSFIKYFKDFESLKIIGKKIPKIIIKKKLIAKRHHCAMPYPAKSFKVGPNNPTHRFAMQNSIFSVSSIF